MLRADRASCAVTTPDGVTVVSQYSARTVTVTAHDRDRAWALSLSIIAFLGHAVTRVRSGPG